MTIAAAEVQDTSTTLPTTQTRSTRARRHDELKISVEWWAGLPKTPVSADLVIRDPDGRVLFCRAAYRPTWWVIGGVAEYGEPPAACARREGREELGIDLQIGRLLVVHHQVRPGLVMRAFAFDAGVIDPDLTELVLDPDEITEVGWFPPDGLPADLVPWHARRYRAAINALGDGSTAYLEDTEPEPDPL